MQNEINELRELIKKNYTVQYAMELGLPVSTNKNFSCLCKDHVDSDPSMSLWKAKGFFHCHSCHRNYDAFNIAEDYENKPFSNETVFYLAERFNLPYAHLQKELTPEDIEKQELYRVMSLVTEYVISHKNENYLSKRNITIETANEIGIGSVDSYINLEKFLLSKNVKKKDMEKIGIFPDSINENKLVFILKNKYNYPISFSSREMVYTKDRLKKSIPWKEEYDLKKTDKKDRAEEKKEIFKLISKDTLIPLETIEKYFNTGKYINGRTTILYDKSSYLYMIGYVDKENKKDKPIYVCEGQMDCVSTYQNGFKNFIAICSTSFTEKHLKMLEKEDDVEKVIFALDSDEAGKRKTKQISEKLMENPNLLKDYSFAIFKTPGKDIDEILNENKVNSLKEIYDFKTLFDFKLLSAKEKFGDDLDEDILFDKTVEIIARSDNPRVRERQTNSLMEYLPSFSKSTVLEAISEIRNGKKQIYNKEVISKVNVTVDSIKVNPSNATGLLEDLITDINEVDVKYEIKKTNIRDRSLRAFKEIEEDKQNADLFEVNFNFPWFDHVDLNLGNSVVISSLANIGKSSIFQFLSKKLTEDTNNNVVLFYVTTDDTSKKVWENMIATISGLPRTYTSNPYYHKKFGVNKNDSEMSKRYYQLYNETVNYLEKLQNEGRLIILDIAEGMGDWENLKKEMKEIGNDPFYKKKFKIMVVDSVNNISVEGINDENKAVAFLSSEIKKKSQNHGFLSILNFELNKLRDNSRLSQYALSGTKKIFYNCDLLSFVYNPSRNLKEQNGTDKETKMVWEFKGMKQPIIVTLQDKTKVGNNEMVGKPYFYKLNTINNVMEAIELDSEEHGKYEEIWTYEWENYYKTYIAK